MRRRPDRYSPRAYLLRPDCCCCCWLLPDVVDPALKDPEGPSSNASGAAADEKALSRAEKSRRARYTDSLGRALLLSGSGSGLRPPKDLLLVLLCVLLVGGSTTPTPVRMAVLLLLATLRSRAASRATPPTHRL